MIFHVFSSMLCEPCKLWIWKRAERRRRRFVRNELQWSDFRLVRREVIVDYVECAWCKVNEIGLRKKAKTKRNATSIATNCIKADMLSLPSNQIKSNEIIIENPINERNEWTKYKGNRRQTKSNWMNLMNLENFTFGKSILILILIGFSTLSSFTGIAAHCWLYRFVCVDCFRSYKRFSTSIQISNW